MGTNTRLQDIPIAPLRARRTTREQIVNGTRAIAEPDEAVTDPEGERAIPDATTSWFCKPVERSMRLHDRRQFRAVSSGGHSCEFGMRTS